MSAARLNEADQKKLSDFVEYLIEASEEGIQAKIAAEPCSSLRREMGRCASLYSRVAKEFWSQQPS